jgi:SOS response regulatory protein OraA/RecX
MADHAVETALERAARLLAARDLSSARLAERLSRDGVEPEVVEHVLAALTEAGYLDDTRLAMLRATRLAAKGYGDRLIADRMARDGIDGAAIESAIGALEPETARARALAVSGGDPRGLATRLARRGFSEEAIEAAVDDPRAGELDG